MLRNILKMGATTATPSEGNVGVERTEVRRHKIHVSNKLQQNTINKLGRKGSDVTVSLTENSTTTSTAESDFNHERDSANLSVQRKKKSVTFNEQEEIFLIPTRQEIEALLKAAYNKNISRYVRFDKLVTVFPIPSRNAFSCIAGDIWYNKDEITSMEKEVFDSL